MIPQVVDVTAITGQRVVGPLTSWQTKDGPYNVEHLAGMSPNGDLLTFFWSPRANWTAVNISQITNQKIASPVTSWQTKDGPYNVEHLAGMSPNGDLLTFFWSPRANWQGVNATRIANAEEGHVVGVPTPYQLRDGQENVELLAARGADLNNYFLLLFWWKSRLDWQVMNISEITGERIISDPQAWISTSGNSIVEHLAAEGHNNRLLVFFGDSEARKVTDALSRPFQSLKRQRNIHRKVIAILWDPHRPTDPALSVSSIESAIFGKSNSVRDYY